MDLYSAINNRKSCRSYKAQPLSNGRQNGIREAINTFGPLYPDVPLDWRFVSEAKGVLRSQVPHYLVISGRGRAGEQENAGSVFEQLILWLHKNGIGSTWRRIASTCSPGALKSGRQR